MNIIEEMARHLDPPAFIVHGLFNRPDDKWRQENARTNAGFILRVLLDHDYLNMDGIRAVQRAEKEAEQ